MHFFFAVKAPGATLDMPKRTNEQKKIYEKKNQNKNNNNERARDGSQRQTPITKLLYEVCMKMTEQPTSNNI